MAKYKTTNGDICEIGGVLFSGVLDKKGSEIYEGDTLRFTDKWEWYRSRFGGGWQARQSDYDEVLSDHAKYPYEDRVIKLPADYEWLLSSEIQTYWQIVGNG